MSLKPNDVVTAYELRTKPLPMPVRDWLLTALDALYMEAVEEGRQQLADEMKADGCALPDDV